MELKTTRDSFDRVTKKQKLASSKSQEVIDQAGHEIEQALSKFQSESVSSDDQKAILTELATKLNEIGPHKQLEASQKDLNVSLSKYMKLLERTFNPDLSKAYRHVDFDIHTVNQIIANHFYRQGLFELGDCLATEGEVPEAATLKSQFMEMFEIIEAMKVKNLEPALKWVSTNREKLKQHGLDLELKLHRLQFVEILRKGNRADALNYARTHLASFASIHMVEFQKLMGCLLWVGRLDISPYPDLMAPAQWDTLAEELARQFCNFLGQSYESPLSVAIAAGVEGLPTLLKLVNVMAAKKPEWQAMKQLPVPVDLGREFQFHSIFVCPVSRDQASDENPSMLMPCGHVLCKQSIIKLSKGNSRTFKCPYCPAEVSVAQCKQLHF